MHYVIETFVNTFLKKNAVLSKPVCVFKNGVLFHTHSAQENILCEKQIDKNLFFFFFFFFLNQKITDF